MYLPSFGLDGKVAVVTGAGRGIGKALALGLAEAGADVAIIARTSSDLEEVSEQIKSIGRRAFPVCADITDRKQVNQAITNIYNQAGSINILINNAGMNIRTPAIEVTDDEWETIFQTNLKSAFMLSQAVAPYMKQSNNGRIINISSVGGHVALRTGVVYASTKAAMIQMTKVLAVEWAQYGINVNSIGPWYFKTPLTEKLLSDPEYIKDILDRTPLKRVGELQDLVGPTVFLCSEAANYVTGQTLFVDGGMTIYGF
jgi:NAD(P)-dependent dehydrogenase (short-subunit alcohol dehydrogenase family)